MTIQRRKHKIKKSYGMVDYFNYYRKTYNRRRTVTTYKKFSSILNDINQAFADEFAETGYEIKFPKRMGMMCISKKKGKSWINADGKVRTNRPVNYKATKELWAKDPEAAAKKTLIRLEKYDRAFEYLQSAFEICVDTKNYYLAATTMQNIAAVCLKIGRRDLALQFCNRALALATDLEIPLVKECQEFKEQLLSEVA